MEQLACEVYKAASDYFTQDKEFCSFLSRLAEDESLHFDLMGSAAEYLKETREHPVSAIDLESNMREQLETPLKRLSNLMCSHSLTKKAAVECIFKVEFSEWNHLFLYVIDTFQKYIKRFQYIAAAIQAHEQRIVQFLEDLPEDLNISEDFRKLPRIWNHKILIVEDEASIRKLFAQVLTQLGTVETATNGQEAIDKVKDHFFNVVISDIDMPVMSGLEFYQKAVEMDPEIGRHFLFCSGNITSDIETFCRERDLMHLEKPIKLKQLYAAVQGIMGKTL
jgi:CheY-like chemotaxis protein/rubrerythrin